MLIDAYQHIGMPRFQTAEDAVAVMDAFGIDRALVCPYEACPDIARVHAAVTAWPDRLRGLGVPVGGDRTEVSAAVRAQLDAGLIGLRLSGADVADRPWLLDRLGEGHGVAFVCGAGGLASGAPALLRYLDRYGDGLVVGGHFAGPTDAAVFGTDPAVAELFGHERFAAVLSRQSLISQELLDDWTRELIDRCGWHRLLWGSEAPVLYWRDESIDDARRWIELWDPTAEQREQFYSANAQRLLFSRPAPPPAPLRLPFDPWDLAVSQPSPTWPKGLPLDSALTGRLVHGWLAWGGSARGPLHRYLQHVLDEALPDVSEPQARQAEQ